MAKLSLKIHGGPTVLWRGLAWLTSASFVGLGCLWLASTSWVQTLLRLAGLLNWWGFQALRTEGKHSRAKCHLCAVPHVLLSHSGSEFKGWRDGLCCEGRNQFPAREDKHPPGL